MNRFLRQTILPGFEGEGQEKLSKAKVLVVGAGGLGCPALLYLAAMGVGTIGIADGDRVTESNLNRQVLFGSNDIGQSKAHRAVEYLTAQYPDVQFCAYPEYLSTANALDTIEQYDLVIDGSDNFPTRYMINDACVLLEKPLVMGAIYQYEGQVAVFNYGSNPVNYRHIYPNPPKPDEVPNCHEAGVLGVLPGIIGTLQAAEAVKVITGLGVPLSNKMLFYNLKTSEFYEIEIAPASLPTTAPVDKAAFRLMDYAITCETVAVLTWKRALEVAREAGAILIDVREKDEVPRINFNHLQMPISEAIDPDSLAVYDCLLLFCQTGIRSRIMAESLQQQFPEKKIYSIEGGIMHATSPVNL